MKNELLNDDPSTISEVTPAKKVNRLWPINHFYLVAGIGLLLIAAAFLPENSKARETREEPANEQTELTLSQNLALIEQMKEEQVKLMNTNPLVSYLAPPIKPPKLRSKSSLSKEMLARMNAPTTFLNTSQSTNNATNHEQGSTPSSTNLLTGDNKDTQFINQQNEITSVSATRLPHPFHTIPAGEVISATLETAINSELAGMVRAITTRDIYSLEGQNRLMPRGSQLVGQFNSVVIEGQSRIFVVWNRVQLANGIIITLNSPSTDRIGRSGQGADYINRHFFERFSESALLSVLGAYTANSGVNGQDEYNSRSQYRTSIATSFQQASNQSLQANANIKPTLQVNQGTEINVFVAHDLDFHVVRLLAKRN
jgi:type IV secretion system protein VirB10